MQAVSWLHQGRQMCRMRSILDDRSHTLPSAGHFAAASIEDAPSAERPGRNKWRSSWVWKVHCESAGDRRRGEEVPDPNGTVVLQGVSWNLVVAFQSCLEDCSRFLHELVTMSAAFEDSGFDPARTVGHFALRNLPQ